MKPVHSVPFLSPLHRAHIQTLIDSDSNTLQHSGPAPSRNTYTKKQAQDKQCDDIL